MTWTKTGLSFIINKFLNLNPNRLTIVFGLRMRISGIFDYNISKITSFLFVRC